MGVVAQRSNYVLQLRLSRLRLTQPRPSRLTTLASQSVPPVHARFLAKQERRRSVVPHCFEGLAKRRRALFSNFRKSD